MNIRDSRKQKITWVWEKETFHSTVTYTSPLYQIMITRRRGKIEVILKNNRNYKYTDLSHNYGNIFMNITQIKKYAEY